MTNDKESRITRETIMRYVLLSYVLCIRRFSKNLRKFVPDAKCLIDTGENEFRMYLGVSPLPLWNQV